MKEILKGINATYFFNKYTTIKNHKHKLRGVDGNKKPIEFSISEKKEIVSGLKAMIKDIVASLK